MIFETVKTGGFIYRAEKQTRKVSKPASQAWLKTGQEMPESFKAPKVGSKQAEAVKLFKKNKGDRKATIVDIMNFLGMSKAGATTYAYNAMKIVGK